MKHSMYPKAIARIHGGKQLPQLSGIVRFFQSIDGVIVEAEIIGLPETETGFFAFHIHEGGNCNGEDFSNTDGHFDHNNEAAGLKEKRKSLELQTLFKIRKAKNFRIFSNGRKYQNVRHNRVVSPQKTYRRRTIQ